MFGNSTGEKKQHINEVAAYYLARAVFFYLFSSTVCFQNGTYSMKPLCLHICHTNLFFSELHHMQLNFSKLLMTPWLDREFVFVFYLLQKNVKPPKVRCRHGVSSLFIQHTNAPTLTHWRLQRNIDWITGLFTQCLSAGYGQDSPVYMGVGFMVSLTVSNKHLPLSAARSQQKEPCFRSGR